jgi:hypothetical protein
MSERNISISPYIKADNIIELVGFIEFRDVEERIEIPERKHLILYNYSLQNGEVLVPRTHDSFRIVLKPKIRAGHAKDDFYHLLLKGEPAQSAMTLRLQVWCKNTRWCSHQHRLTLSEVDGKTEVSFDIPLHEIKEEIIVSGFVVREVRGRIKEKRKADAIYSILSTCDQVSIQTDERKEIGGNHLPIDFEDLPDRNMVFDIQGLQNDYDLPRIKCSKEFQEFFVRDDLGTVNAAFMMAMFHFFDSYLKWLIFNCKYDSHDKSHRGLIESFAKHCGISKAELIELVEEKKYSENQIRQYLKLSHSLMRGIQSDSQIKYAKELKQIIKTELQ